MVNFKHHKGFTLIELLVVVAIISLLASIVMASLNSARIKGKDAALKQETLELRKILELEYDDTGGYNISFLASVSVGDSSCDSSGSEYSSQANEICKNILDNSPITEDNNLSIFVDAQNYAMSVLLNDGSTFFCVKSDGTVSEGGFSDCIL